MDKDASGAISKAELAHWIKAAIGLEPDVEDEEEVEERFAALNVDEAFNVIDADQDGQLSYDELNARN